MRRNLVTLGLQFLNDLIQNNNFSWLKEKKGAISPRLFSKVYEEFRTVKLDTSG